MTAPFETEQPLPELLHLVQCRARHQAATAELHQAAAAVVAAGCPLRTAAAAAGVSSPQTIANWAAQATTEEP